MSSESNDRKTWEYDPKVWESTPQTAELDAIIASARLQMADMEYFVQTGACSRTRVPISEDLL